MAAETVPFRRGSSKTRGPITVELSVHAGNQPLITELSLLEREVVKFTIADQVALALRRDGDVSAGHKTAIYAHLVALLQRDGPLALQDYVATLLGMVRTMCAPPPDEPFEDDTDWSENGLS